MAIKYALACTFLVFFAFVQTGESLKCYKAVASTEDGTEITCPEEENVTYKCYLSTIDPDAEKWTRDCTKNANQCTTFTPETCGTCSDDLCNDASALTSTTILTVCSFFLIKMFY